VVSERLKHVILAELGIDDCPISDETVAAEVPGWDSLSHVRILCAVEREFGLTFGSLEVLRLKNVGQLQALVDRKLAR